MLNFLESNLTLWLGPLLGLALFGLRQATRDRKLRRDVSGAIGLLVTFIVIRLVSWAVRGSLPTGAAKAAQVAWMLAFAFAIIRSAVSIALWSIRLRSYPTPKILRDVVDAALYSFASIVILKSELDIDLTGIAATSAVLSVVLGLALQDTLGNLFAGLSIQIERPFQVGDYVTIRDITGKVVQIAWRATRLETGRREVITLPNSILSKEAVKNYSRGPEPVGIDLEFRFSVAEPPNRVKDVLLDAVRDVPLVLAAPPPRVRTIAYEDAHVRYRVRYFVADFAQSDQVTDEVYSHLWYRLKRTGIELPNPQLDLHLRNGASGPEVVPEAVQEMLASVDLFTLVPADERKRLAADLIPKRFGRGERIINQGDHGETFYIIASGEVTVRVGKSHMQVARLRVGQYFGEMALLTGDPRTASVVAETDVLLMELSRESFRRLFAASPGLAKHLSALLSERRSQLRAVAVNSGEPDPAPEEGHILSRLRNMFALHD